MSASTRNIHKDFKPIVSEKPDRYYGLAFQLLIMLAFHT